MGLVNPQLLRIANLNADTPVPNVRPQYQTYGSMFHPLLVQAAREIAPGLTVKSTEYDTVLGEYPASLSDFDAILVTGSASSSYDDAKWIRKLGAYLRDVYVNHPHVRIFGSCFGHQILCQSLLEEYGAVVEKDPNGWEIGVHEICLNDQFRRIFASKPSIEGEEAANSRLLTPERESESPPATVPPSLRLQFVHADHVRLDPTKRLPDSWIPMGSSKHCNVQGFCEPGRVLTFQGHFEFDRFVNTEVLKVFGAAWDEDVRQKSLEQIDANDDSLAAAQMVLRFFTSEKRAADPGLLTPPLLA